MTPRIKSAKTSDLLHSQFHLQTVIQIILHNSFFGKKNGKKHLQDTFQSTQFLGFAIYELIQRQCIPSLA